jgi:GTP diphosphokinase / guanosine-3',5'-bis(diphosphate) 3'-diphosphatase
MTTLLDLGQFLKAVEFAARKHNGQIRKDQAGSPYITHPLLVAKELWETGHVTNQDTLIAAVLHDTIEDTDTRQAEIREIFGEEVLSIVLEVTDNKILEKMERKSLQVMHAPSISHQAKTLKLGDKIVNCRDILNSPPKSWPLERRRRYIQWAADVVAGMRGTNQALEKTFDQILARAEEELDFQIEPITTLDNRPWDPAKF